VSLIVSAQDGPWTNPDTWVGGVVPNPFMTDDVAVFHAVSRDEDLFIGNGHYVYIGPYAETGGQLMLMSGAGLFIDVGLLEIDGEFLSMDSFGDVIGSGAGPAEVHVNPTGAAYFLSGSTYVQGATTVLNIHGLWTNASNHYLTISQNAKMVVGETGFLGMMPYGHVWIDFMGLIDVQPGAVVYTDQNGSVELFGGTLRIWAGSKVHVGVRGRSWPGLQFWAGKIEVPRRGVVLWCENSPALDLCQTAPFGGPVQIG